MSNEELLTNYRENVNKLRETAKSIHMTDDEINELFEDCLRNLNNYENVINTSKRNLASRILFLLKLIFIFLIIFVLVFIFLNHHQPTLSLVLRNVQGFIYPSLKLLRLLAMPVIKVFPTLSELYDETCLIENPYFEVSNMECWPCEDVHSVINLTGSTNYSLYQSGIPYIIQTLHKPVSLEDIQELYRNNSHIFIQDAQRIKSNNPQFLHSTDLLHFVPNNSNTHISWRINRMAPARIVRSLFPKPYIISRWSGQSTERYLMVDDLHGIPYVLPNTECSSVVLTQSRGERTIVLKPSKECSGQCRTTSVILKATYSLWYNWWYWRPISFPAQNATDISISYLTSYC